YPHACPFLPLPPYPWQRERYWFADGYADHAITGARKLPLLGRRLGTADAIWKHRLDPAVLPWISEHAIQDSVVLPRTAFIEMALAAASSSLGSEAVEVEGLEIRRPLIVTAGAMPVIEISVSMEDGSWRLHTGDDAAAAEPPIAAARVSAANNSSRIGDSPAALRQR